MTATNSDYGHIYIVHAIGTNRYKIGLTRRDVETRFRELNSSQSAYPLELMGSISTWNVAEVERELHQRFANYRVHGEWFEFTDYQFEQVVNIVNEYEYQQPNYQPEYSYPQYSYSSYDDSFDFGTIVGVCVAIVIGIGFIAALSGGLKPAYNEKLATPENKQLKYNFDICTDGKAGNDEHLNCQQVVTEYKSKFSK
ncbi:MAG: GIY-YIG nuclease family protein [Cyanobacteria bacterium P01_D01_bin.50]